MSDTLAAMATHTMVLRQSRFVASAAHVESIDEALAFIAATSAPDATHNCWAYRIGDQYRSSDDGEPSGTAGRPILAAIDGQGLDAVVAVVARWFGGIKLGAGGLVRAYGGAAAQCLQSAARRPLVILFELHVHARFDDIGAVHAAMQAHGARVLQEAFDSNGLRMRLAVPQDLVEAFTDQLRDATRNRVQALAQPKTSAG
ncbi:MAG: hypothetical protein JWL98_2203 [Xanthomonadaceae bacterium]|nr:hypothetical protein [Xanthomonadaceae bacterium]